jgi:hypothetical protein
VLGESFAPALTIMLPITLGWDVSSFNHIVKPLLNVYSFTFKGFFENKINSEHNSRMGVTANFFIDSCFVDIHSIRLYNKSSKINEMFVLFVMYITKNNAFLHLAELQLIIHYQNSCISYIFFSFTF